MDSEKPVSVSQAEENEAKRAKKRGRKSKIVVPERVDDVVADLSETTGMTNFFRNFGISLGRKLPRRPGSE